MRLYLAAALAFASTVLAQVGTISDLPQCGQQAILQAIQSSGCPLTDIACMCKNTDFVDELVGQIPQLCSAGDIALTAEGSEAICTAYGVDLNLPDLAGVSNSTSSSATTATTSETTATSATAGTESSTTETSSDSSTSAAASTTTSASSTSTPASSTESSAAAATSNAAIANTVGLSGFVGAALLGLAAVV